VTSTAPAIYARNLTEGRLTLFARAVALGVAGACLALLIVAAMLEPDPRGIGSHRTMGLDPCQFEYRTGVPCITCGMTTSFAHFVRGQLPASFYVQPMGMILALLTAIVFWAALYIAVTARPVHRVLRFFPLKLYLFPLFALMIVAWIWKIGIHVTGRDGWT
jgi:hypothetical protein